jgi:hypothetical protein
MLHSLGLLIIGLALLIPMPIAGGIPVLLATMVCLGIISVRMHITGAVSIHPQLVTVFACAMLLLGWESFTALFHYTMRDLELIAARGVWIILGFGYLTILAGTGADCITKSVARVLLIGCSAILIAMTLESMFYPTYEVGRQLGTINIPWPRATGVPQSDGKIGVYICLASVFFVVAFINTKKWYMLLGIILAITPILFTQSRSTLVGLLLTQGFLFLYYVRTTRNIYIKILAILGGTAFLLTFLVNYDVIYSSLKGEGVFARNVDARSVGTDHALDMIGNSPFVGPGAEYLLVTGMHKLEVHSTFLGMAVKSGIPGPILFIAFMLLSASLACSRSSGLLNNLLMVSALVAGPISEHNLYPGYFNEHLWILAPIALAVYQYEHARQPRESTALANKTHPIPSAS